MKTFKKALSIILGLAMMLSCVAGMQISASAEGTSSFTVTVGDGSAKAGEIVEVPVTLSNVVGGYTALGFAIDYDPAVLTLAEKVAVTGSYDGTGDSTTSTFVFEQSENLTDRPYNLIWAYVDDEPNTADGIVATLKFTVNANATAGATTTVAIAANAKSGSMNGNADVAVEYVNGTVTVKEEEPVCTHETTKWVMTTVPDPKNDGGVQTKTCAVCGESLGETRTVKAPRFRQRTLLLQDKVIIQFYVRQSDTADNGYTNYKVVFNCNGVDYVVEEYEAIGTDYAFNYNECSPEQFADTVTATVYGQVGDDETWYQGRTTTYSVTAYAESALTETKSDLNVLLVDILNYGAAAQRYVSYKTDALVNASLSETQKTWASEIPDPSTYVSIKKNNVLDSTPATQTAGFKNATLFLGNCIAYDLRFDPDNSSSERVSLDGYSIRVTLGDEVIDEVSYAENPDAFTPAPSNADQYVFRCTSLKPCDIRQTAYFEILKDGAVVSKALSYNVDTYAREAYDNANSTADLLYLLDYIVAYANGAYNYIY